MKTNAFDIHERIFNYVIEVIHFLNLLPKTATNLIFISQCTRSVSSMGANDQEADGALTTNDFLHGFTLVRKEGKETIFWLRVMGKLNKQLETKAEILIKEGNEIVAIVSTIIIKTSKKRK
jgi:four helix bundle protein